MHHNSSHAHAMSHANVSYAGAISHGSASDFLRRFWIVTLLLIPLVLAKQGFADFLGVPVLSLNKWIQLAIATVIFWFSLVFFKHARHEIMMRSFGMMTLVSLAVGSGFLFSVASTLIPALGVVFYLEIGTLIWVLLFGHYLEAKSSVAAGNSLSEVARLLPKAAHRISGNVTEDVSVSELREGDVVLVKSGEKIPADGVVLKGTSSVDESLISGESTPISKNAGDSATAGSSVLDGSLTIQLTKVGEHSTVGQIQTLIAKAQATKPRSQKLADKASRVLTFTALGVSLLTIVIWLFVIGKPFVFALTLAITVLVIACPHALGLAIPTVTTIATSLAVKNGLFIKNLAKLEVIKKADYVVFDKTGTLTKGEFGVSGVVSFGDEVNGEDILRIAASLETNSSHVIAQSIARHAKDKGINIDDVDEFHNFSGKGIWGNILGSKYSVGNSSLMSDLGISTDEAMQQANAFSSKGHTVVFVSDKKKIIGVIALADTIKAESYEAVTALHSLGVKVALLTGDNEIVAKNVSNELGIDTYFSHVLPEEKYSHVKSLQGKGHVVLMVGDGINDAPALTQADVGIAIGAGTDVAVEAGDVVLMRNNPQDVVRLVVLARRVYQKMIENLFWALGYNVVAIPAAAGVFASFGFFLRPEIGALLMSVSTAIVVFNALLLKRVELTY